MTTAKNQDLSALALAVTCVLACAEVANVDIESVIRILRADSVAKRGGAVVLHPERR